MLLKFLFGAVAVALIAAGLLAWDWFSDLPPGAMAEASYVGRATCAECHQSQHNLWLGSDHDRAMELASDAAVLGDFNNTSFTYQGVTTRFFRRDDKFMVNTEGPDGQHRDYEIKYTFGVRPLQQYMVEFPDGRVQVLRESWDVANKKWFYVTPPDVTDERIPPGDPLHWTGITQNWNTTCADCHSTNVHKNYDVATNTYRTTFEEIDVSCEECHGPGSVHVDLAGSLSPFWDRKLGYGLVSLKNKNVDVQLEMCAKCHARRYQIHEDFRPGKPLLDHYEPALLSRRLYHSDGQILDEVYEYGSFVQSKMYANRVQCSDCHDPHSLKLKFPGNQLCAQCHVPAKYDTPNHHHHPVDSAGAQCVECHMPSRLYMVIDGRRDHSFRVPRPDLSVKLGTPNACNDCHTRIDETFQWAAEAVRKWYGDPSSSPPLNGEGLGEGHWAPAIAAGYAAQPYGGKLLAELADRKTTPAIVRATAVDLLANYRSRESEAARRGALIDSDPLVRLAGVRSVTGDFGPELASLLAGKADDSVRSVRVAAAARMAYLPLQHLPGTQRAAFERAFAEFQTSQALSLDHAGGHLTLGAIDRAHRRPNQAIAHFQAAIRLEPYMAGPRAELASLLQVRAEDVRSAIQISQVGPLLATFYEQMGEPAEMRRLRLEEAELLERDVRLAPENAEIYYRLGLLRFLLGQLDEAQTALTAACDRAPENYEFLMMLALLHERRYVLEDNERQLNAAALALKKMHELEPADPRARQILERLLETRRSRESSESSER
jgi:tetratricopeptide (TPR) repeat protein